MKMIQIFQEYQGSVIAVKRVNTNDVSRYGIVKCRQITDRIYHVVDLVEKPRLEEAPSNLAIMGRYVLAPEIFNALYETLPGRNGEIQLTDALRKLLKDSPVYAYEFEGERWDAGTLEGWLETNVALSLRHPHIGPRMADYLNGIMSATTRAETKANMISMKATED